MSNKIIHGNCLEILPTIPEPYYLMSDPPYNQNYHYDEYQDVMKPDVYKDLLVKLFKDKPAVIILYPEETINLLSALGTCQKVVSWVYPSNTPKQHRLITWWNCKPDFSRIGQVYRNTTDKRIRKRIAQGAEARLYDWWEIDQVKNVNKEIDDHPCPIPEEIARRIILLTTNVDDVIVDPFCGSGTIPYMAKVYNRTGVGIELSEKYCKLAQARMGRTSLANFIKKVREEQSSLASFFKKVREEQSSLASFFKKVREEQSSLTS